MTPSRPPFLHRSRRLAPLSRVLPLLAAALVQGGCAADGDAPPPPDATTADLLASDMAPVSRGRPTVPGTPSRQIPLAELGYDRGDAAAPVKLLEFSDFGCGYCRRFHEDVWPTLEKEYVETGKVHWKYVPMILGIFPNAMEAARAGECAGAQGRFPIMQARLFAEQSRWKNSKEPMVELEAMAGEVGLDVPRWRQCVDDGARNDRIAAGTQLAQQAGVRGTPTFFVIGYAPIPGALPLELFREVLDTAVAAALRGDGPGGVPSGSGG